MADHLHPAIDIPGEGLWEGACVAHSEGDGVCVEDQRGCHAVLCVLYDDDGEARLAHPSVARLSLRLDDPLGLGLAGLAARVTERAGISWSVTDGMEALEPHLARARWAPGHWFCIAKWAPTYRLAVAYADAVREAATLLARLDRLAAQVWPEYRVEAGRVPTWERVRLAPWSANLCAWTLTVEPVGTATWTEAAHPSLDTTDPIEAAGAALEVRGG